MNHSPITSSPSEQGRTWPGTLAYGLILATAAAAEFLPNSPIAHEVGHQFGHGLECCQKPAQVEATTPSPFDSLKVPNKQ